MKGRVRVKICGITNDADARSAIDLGADALGFNLFPGSKRCLDLEREAAWIAALPPLVTRVAVLVNAPIAEAQRVAAHPAIDCVQLHGDEDEDYCAEMARGGRPFIKALRVREARDIEGANRFWTGRILLDAHSGGDFGGTGRSFDPALAVEARERFPGLKILLAGGLRAENVAAAIRVARPYAVDVASGVESEPGRKDAAKLAAFFAAVAAA